MARATGDPSPPSARPAGPAQAGRKSRGTNRGSLHAKGMLGLFLLFLLASPSRLPVLAEEASSAGSGHDGAEDSALPPSCPDEKKRESFLGSLSFFFDNDVFAGKDNRYTAGLAFAWTSAAYDTYGEKSLQRKIMKAFSFLPTVNAEGYRNYLQWVIGMEMFTPSDISLPDPPPWDHPYSGVLYLDSSLMSRSRVSGHQFTLRLGFVGPYSGASEVQKWVHGLIGSGSPQGWDTQLHNEPIVNLFYQYARRLLRKAPPKTFGFDFTVNGGGGVGNYYIGGNAGLMARAGYRVPDNYGATPMLGGAEPLVGIRPQKRRFFVYAFLSSQGFGVVRWLPVDGNTFEDSRSGERDSWYASITGGILAGYGRVVVGYEYNGIMGLSDLRRIQGHDQNDYGSIMFTVFLG